MNSEDSNIPAKKMLIFEHLSTKPFLPRKSTRTGPFAVGKFLKRRLTLAAAIVTLFTFSACSRPSIPLGHSPRRIAVNELALCLTVKGTRTYIQLTPTAQTSFASPTILAMTTPPPGLRTEAALYFFLTATASTIPSHLS